MGKRPQPKTHVIREFVVRADGTEREITGTDWTWPDGHQVYEVLQDLRYAHAAQQVETPRQAA